MTMMGDFRYLTSISKRLCVGVGWDKDVATGEKKGKRQRPRNSSRKLDHIIQLPLVFTYNMLRVGFLSKMPIQIL